MAVAARPVGVVGAAVSGVVCVVALAAFDWAETLPAASSARTL